MMSQRMLQRLMPWLVTIGILVIWEAGTYFGKVDRTLLPQPSSVFIVMFKNIGLLTEYALFTLMTTVIGFAVATVGDDEGGQASFLGSRHAAQRSDTGGPDAVDVDRPPRGAGRTG